MRQKQIGCYVFIKKTELAQMNQPQAKNLRQKLKPLLPYFSLPLILLLAFGLISIARPLQGQLVHGEYGVYDLRGFELVEELLGDAEVIDGQWRIKEEHGRLMRLSAILRTGTDFQILFQLFPFAATDSPHEHGSLCPCLVWHKCICHLCVS